MKVSLEKKMYLEIQKRLFSIIPEKWDSIYLYASVIDMPNRRVTGEMYFYYFPKGIIKKKPINCYEIPSGFNIDETEYGNLISELYNLIKNLRRIYYKKYSKKWSSITISIDNTQFKIEYDYGNLNKSIFDSYERHIIWRYNYLKTDLKLFSKNDKKIIEQYLKFADINKIDEKDTYVEEVYKLPVKNIVDYEKVLSVEEALARTEEDDEDNNQYVNGIFGKKKKYKDIFIDDEEGPKTNNQILNWKK